MLLNPCRVKLLERSSGNRSVISGRNILRKHSFSFHGACDDSYCGVLDHSGIVGSTAMSGYKDLVTKQKILVIFIQYLLKPLLSIISEGKDRKILDIGCGNGWLTNYLIENGFDAYGTDASQSGIEIARRKNPTKFFVQDLTKDDLPDELKNINFNTIISTEVIEHLYSPREYLDFCKRILQWSGVEN